TIASAYGLGRGWGGIWPFLLAAGGGGVLAAGSTARLRLSNATPGYGLLALAGWCLFAALGPTVLGIDHQGLLDIRSAGDKTALNLTLHDGSHYPLKALAPIAAWCGLLAICAMRWSRNEPRPRSRVGVAPSPRERQVAA